MGLFQRDDAEHEDVGVRPPKFATVIVFVGAFAVMASWLGVYGVTNALVAAESIPAFTPGSDPRPRWMLTAFIGFFATFTLISIVFQWASHRQMKRIDDIANAEDRFSSY